MGIKNILRWLIGFTLLCLPAVGAVASEQVPPQARQGALNLEHWNFLRDGLVKLEGEYTFVWDRLIPPNEAIQETTFLKVPGPWTSQPYPIEGQASYQLRLKVPMETNLHLMTLMIAPNARIFINGREQANFGPVDATGRQSGVETYPQRYRVFPLPEGRELLITIHILNHLQRPPGILQPFVLGTSDQLVAFERGTKILDGMILGSLFALTLYHIFLYLLRPKDRTPLYFGICLVACFFYWLVAGYTSPINAFWDIHDADRLTVFFLIYFVVPAFSEYVSLAYPGLFPTRFLRPLWLGTLASFVIVAVVPIQLKFVVMSIYFVTFFPTAAWLCGRAVWKAHQRGDHGSMLFLAGILVLVASTIHDDMMYRMAFSNFPLIGWGVVAFSLIQSYFISARFSQAFTRAETSEAEIRLMNRDLEKIIEEKTRDIRSIMEHIPLGVFMFDANNYGIHKDYSVQSHRIFNRSKLQGLNALQLLFDRSQLTLDEKNQASCAVDSALDQELFNFEANAHCLPLEIIRQDQGREAFFELSWSPIEDAENKIQRLLVTMRDVTEFRSLQRKAQEQNDTLEILAEILKVPPKRFTEFMRDGLQTLSNCEALLQNTSPKGSERLVQDLFVPIHT
ncbi:MAG: hypothetical protein M3Q07_01925, partial [Pseudobdellovibrionaceae bacterium]|nr:hypothetical protein [Pseudobdellovibrionaceae bacterium]